MSCWEFAVRQAHFELEPYGGVFNDLINARLCAVVHNTSTGVSFSKSATARKTVDYMYNVMMQEKRFPNPEEVQKKMEAYFSSLGSMVRKVQ